VAHQSLYRRYRPQRFDELKGQDHVVRALRNAAAEDRVGHAYLFSGPRGTGKTSTARILAKVLNCAEPEEGEPCGVCDSCVSVEAGNSFDVTELDAASNRRIDDIRDLIATTALASPGRTRMYILDEVHMLTKEASAALLKTLEEPPDHVVFVLATTDPQLVLPTIRSRTQHLEFTLLPADDLNALVTEVVADAGLDVDDEGVARALRDGAGSARDTLSALDRIVASGGVIDEGESIVDLMDALAEHDTGTALVALQGAIERGRDPRVVAEQLLSELRDTFLVLMQGEVTHLADDVRDRVRAHADRLRAPAITRALEAVGEALVEMRHSADPRVPLEVALVRLTRPELDPSPASLVERIERLERQARSGGGGGGADGSPTPFPSAATAGPTPAAASSAGSSPAAAARERLAATSGPVPEESGGGAALETGGGVVPDPSTSSGDAGSRPRPALGRRRHRPEPEPPAEAKEAAGASARPEPVVDPQPSDGPPAESVGAAPSAPGAADLPTRDELTLAWGDTLLDGMRPKIRALFAAGRFTTVEDGAAHFALPNATHRKRCESFRDDVENVLAAHFGRPVPMVLVVDSTDGRPAAAATTAGGGGAVGSGKGDAGSTPGVDEEAVDVSELEDAGPTSTGVDQLADVFGAVDVVEQPEEGSS
jgi:DNA polymerase-3 subunit gamma/tau